MTHEQYIKRMKELADELHVASNARPYDPANYNRIIDEFNALYQARQAKPKSRFPLRKITWAGKRNYAAARRLRKILKKVVTS